MFYRPSESPALAWPSTAEQAAFDTQEPARPWHTDVPFLLRHGWLPLVVAAVVLFGMEQTTIDLWLADRWYALEGGQWAWRNSWAAYDLIHHHGKQLVIAIGVAALTLAILSCVSLRWRRWRAPMTYLFTTMAVVPALIAGFKKISPVNCPWDLSRFGGSLPYVRTFDHDFALTSAGHCFPAGHASGGYILLAMYFAALPFVKRPALYLAPGLLIGWTFALGQQSRGGHFLSHDLWSLTLCWFGALAMFLLFRPHTWMQNNPKIDAS